jgi:hypothetical protein
MRKEDLNSNLEFSFSNTTYMSVITDFEHLSTVPSPSMSRRVQLRKKLADGENLEGGEGEQGECRV